MTYSAPAESTRSRLPSVSAEDLRTYLMSLSAGERSERTPDVPQGLVDVRTAAAQIVVLPAPAWSDPELRFLVRPEVAQRLAHAAAVLPADLRLGFWEGLRPITVQRKLWSTTLAYLRRSHTEWPAAEVERLAESYVARPDASHPPHSTGSAVDVAVVDAFGRVLTPGDAWGRIAIETAGHALREAGLANYDVEWWHWSYGDEEWARVNDCAPLAFATTPEFAGSGDGI